MRVSVGMVVGVSLCLLCTLPGFAQTSKKSVSSYSRGASGSLLRYRASQRRDYETRRTHDLSHRYGRAGYGRSKTQVPEYQVEEYRETFEGCDRIYAMDVEEIADTNNTSYVKVSIVGAGPCSVEQNALLSRYGSGYYDKFHKSDMEATMYPDGVIADAEKVGNESVWGAVPTAAGHVYSVSDLCIADFTTEDEYAVRVKTQTANACAMLVGAMERESGVKIEAYGRVKRGSQYEAWTLDLDKITFTRQ